jgi:hypothetical protein
MCSQFEYHYWHEYMIVEEQASTAHTTAEIVAVSSTAARIALSSL